MKKQKKRSRINEKVFIWICLLLMIIPGGALLLGIEQPDRLSENRTPASWPEGSALQFVTDKGEYASGINTFFDDNFFYRGFFIRIKNDILLHCFGLSKDLYIGRDDYLFYRNVVDNEQIYNEGLGEEGITDTVETLAQTDTYLKERGKKLIFLLPPQKNEAFPDRLPNTEAMRPEPNYYQRLCDAIKNDNRINDGWIDSISILRDADQKCPVYYKTDFHWNSFGATQVYSAVVNKLAMYSGYENEIFGENDYSVYMSEGFEGGQLMNLPVIEKISETAPFTQKNTQNTSVLVDANENYQIRHYVNSDPNAPLGNVLFIGDSYTEYLLGANSGILDCFRECYFVHLDCSENAFDTYLDNVDYVVFERIESGLGGVVGYLKALSVDFTE